MTNREIQRVLRTKWPSASPEAVRRSKIKMRHGHKLEQERERTLSKLAILDDLIAERGA